MKFLVLYGSVRKDRQGIKAAKFIFNKLRERNHDVMLVDPLDYDFPFLDKMYKELKPNAPEKMEELAEQIRNADGFVFVTGEYNHLPPPALINITDHFLEEWGFRPSAIVSYSAGGFGGIRAAVHMRDYLAEIGCPAIPSSMPVPKVQDAFDDDGKPHDGAWDRRSKRFVDELEWYAKALAAQRKEGTPY